MKAFAVVYDGLTLENFEALNQKSADAKVKERYGVGTSAIAVPCDEQTPANPYGSKKKPIPKKILLITRPKNGKAAKPVNASKKEAEPVCGRPDEWDTWGPGKKAAWTKKQKAIGAMSA